MSRYRKPRVRMPRGRIPRFIKTRIITPENKMSRITMSRFMVLLRILFFAGLDSNLLLSVSLFFDVAF